MVLYADVLLPLALPQRFTYVVSIDLVDFIQVGHRVIVQFGRNKFYAAIVTELHQRKPAFAAKLIDTIADELPIVQPWQVDFWHWIADYYLSTEGEVMNTALPIGLKLNSETLIVLNEYYEGDFESISAEAFVIVQMLRAQATVTLSQIQSTLNKKNVYTYLKELFSLGIAFGEEKITTRYKPKKETYVTLHDEYEVEEKMKTLFDELMRAPKQLQLLMCYLNLAKKNTHIRKKELLEVSGASATIYTALVEKKVLLPYQAEVSRLGTFIKTKFDTIQLTTEQQQAFESIKDSFKEDKTALLFGVTGSGKTEIYTRLIAEKIAEGSQCLYLLPEIALTAQIINRLKGHFGEKLGVYHSKFNDHEKVEIWNKVLTGEYQVIVAVRSGIFLPFKKLGLIVVDEEHDSSFKQIDPAPRYHARDLAIVLAKMHQANVLLGSATPSVESYRNAETGKYTLVKLDTRYGAAKLPKIEIFQMHKVVPRTEYSDLFSSYLIKLIETELTLKKQVILFHNRRGFSTYQICRTCAHIYKCKNCDVSLTYHKFQHRLVCHYCGYEEKIVHHCASCGVADLDIVGNGTEKIEELVATLFPQARVSRLDLDAARGKHAHEHIIATFENREVDILVGTQMVSKGLDFEHVNLVGVLQADNLLFQSGYKSYERAFQLLTQVSGRAGRKDGNGKVVIQTWQPDNPILLAVKAYDYMNMYQNETVSREHFHYPPYSRMIQLSFSDKHILNSENAAHFFANEMQASQVAEVLGPTSPYIGRVNNYYIKVVLLKTASFSKSPTILKAKIKEIQEKMLDIKEFKSVRIAIDVDPI